MVDSSPQHDGSPSSQHTGLVPRLLSTATVLLVLICFVLSCTTVAAAEGDRRLCVPSGQSEDLRGCEVITGDLVVEHQNAKNLRWLSSIRRVEGSLIIRQNFSLETLDGLQQLRRIDGDLQLVTLPNLTDVDGLRNLREVSGDIHVVDVGADSGDIDRLTARIRRPTDGGTSDGQRRGSSQEAHQIERLPTLEELNRGELLEDVHPELVDRIRLMVAVLEKEDIEVVFASGYRPFEHFYDAENRHASWHNLGMAVDLYLGHRDSYDDARRHYQQDQKLWERVGEVAAGLGLIWGESFDDPYHFEWHPGYHARIRRHEFDKFRRLAGDDLEDHRAVWPLFDAPDDVAADTCSGGCHQIPDDGLRRLMHRLR